MDRLTEHSSTVRIQLPNVENADSLAELARQKEDEGRITEHDVDRYLLSVKAIAGSPLYAWTQDKTVSVVLDGPDGAARNDTYQVTDDNRLVLGLGGNDVLAGGGNRDLLDGGAGNDVLQAFASDDVLSGGGGSDRLSSGSGYDRLDYDYLADSSPAARDLILDFGGIGAAAGDRIDLSSIDADSSLPGNQRFDFKGTSAFDDAGQVRVASVASGSDTLIQANADASLATSELEILVRDGSVLPEQWAANDFIL